MASQDESRRGRRVRIVLPVLLQVGSDQVSSRTDNISLLGTFIQAEKEVPAGTTVHVTLHLPPGETGEDGKVECQGVVVRCQGVGPGRFGWGVFFNQFLNDGEARLTRIIDDLLKKQDEEAKRYFEERERLRKEKMKQRLAEKRKKRHKRGRPPKKSRPKRSKKTS